MCKPLILLGFSRHSQLSYCDTDCHCLSLFVKIVHLSSPAILRRSLHLVAFSQKFTYPSFILCPPPCPGQQYLLCCARCRVHNAAPCALCRSGLRGLVQTGTRGGGQKGTRGREDRWTIAEVYFRGRGVAAWPLAPWGGHRRDLVTLLETHFPFSGYYFL